MDKRDSAVILDLRSLVGTANVFSKQDMYRVMYSGPDVDIKHFSNADSISLQGNYKLLVLTVKENAFISIDEKSFEVNRIFVYDSPFNDVKIYGDNLTGTYIALSSFDSEADGNAIVGEAIVGEAIVS